jgi:hypothetical protein
MLLVAVVMVTLLGAVVHVLGSGHRPGASASVDATFHVGALPVGTFSVSGRPLMVSVDIRGLAVSEPVACQLVSPTGLAQTLGVFDLVHGTAVWTAPDPTGIAQDREARLVDGAGRVLATATFR